MKKSFIFVIMLTIIVIPLSAQKIKDALYLKNGSIIYGVLTEITDNQYKIRTSDGSIFIYASSEVDKFLKETPVYEGRKKEGMGLSLEAGLLIGSQQSSYDAPFSFNFIPNYTIQTRNMIGLGSGVEFIGQAYTPFFMEYKRLFNEKRTTPFLFARGGGLLYIGNEEEAPDYNPYYNRTEYKGGVSFSMGTGISWSKEDIETYLSFAYRYFETSYKESSTYQGEVTYKNYYNRLEIKFGFKF